MLESGLPQLLDGVIAGVVCRGLGGDDLIDRLARAVLLAASAYALPIANVSRNVPPFPAVTMIMPALGGPCSTCFHSVSLNSPIPVIASS
jgi:hypothetical protein